MDGQALTTLPAAGNGHSRNPMTLGLTMAGTGELLAGARLGQAGRRATMAAALLVAARRSNWRLPVLSAALAGASLDLGSTRAVRATALVRLGVLATLLREAKRIERWERI